MYQEPGNIVAFPVHGNRALAPALYVEEKLDANRYDLTSILQTTLLTDQLLSLFFNLMQPRIALEGYDYAHSASELLLSGGQPGRHRLSYQLSLEGECLGELHLQRQYPFAAREVELLDVFLKALLYPLRNTLLYRQALRAARTDALTGVGNRADFQAGMARECKSARRHFAPLSLIAVDIDHFKRVNDTYGHPCGDEVLQGVAACLKNTARGNDLVYRYGGEEFMLLLSDTDLHDAAILAERLRQRVAGHACSTEQAGELMVTISVGVAALTAGDTESSLLHRADQALYKAKQQGRNRVVLAEDAV